MAGRTRDRGSESSRGEIQSTRGEAPRQGIAESVISLQNASISPSHPPETSFVGVCHRIPCRRGHGHRHHPLEGSGNSSNSRPSRSAASRRTACEVSPRAEDTLPAFDIRGADPSASRSQGETAREGATAASTCSDVERPTREREREASADGRARRLDISDRTRTEARTVPRPHCRSLERFERPPGCSPRRTAQQPAESETLCRRRWERRRSRQCPA